MRWCLLAVPIAPRTDKIIKKVKRDLAHVWKLPSRHGDV